MQTNITAKRGLGRRVAGTAATAALLLAGSLSGWGQASPTGVTWDCVMSGGRKGLAQVTFFDGGTNGPSTFEALEILVPKNSSSSDDSIDAQRNDGQDATRHGFPPAPPSSRVFTNLFGGFMVGGPWGFDTKGQVVGYFVESTGPTECVTNFVVTTSSTTNQFGDVSTSFSTN